MQSQKEKLKTQRLRSEKFIPFKHLQKLSKRLKKANQKVVFTTGSFDLLNPGHVRYLAEARSLGDTLVVGVSTDTDLNRMKGQPYPLINESLRIELLTYLRDIDYVTFASEDAPHAVLSLLQPDIFFTSQGAWNDGVRDEQEKFIVKSYGGRVVVRKRNDEASPYISTEHLVEHMANIRVLQILEGYIKSKIPTFYLDPNTHLPPADYHPQVPCYKNAFNADSLILKGSDLESFGERFRKLKKKIVFVSGSYDLLHTGHARFIEKAGVLGDILVIGIPSDTSIKKLKGVGRPVISEYSRAYVLAHLDSVDGVVIFEESSIFATLEKLKPDVFFTVNESWNLAYKQSPEYKLVKSYGGNVVLADRQSPFLSSSAIINKVAGEKVREIFVDCMDEDRYKSIINEKSTKVKTS